MIDTEQLRAAYRSAGVDEHLINVPQMYLGLDAHILTFPVKQGRLINVVAFISDRSEPNPVWPPGTPRVKSSSQAQMLDAFAQWDDAVRVLLGCTPEPTLWHHDLQSDLIVARAQLGWAACE
jgi:salicylate hydroxylase